MRQEGTSVSSGALCSSRAARTEFRMAAVNASHKLFPGRCHDGVSCPSMVLEGERGKHWKSQPNRLSAPDQALYRRNDAECAARNTQSGHNVVDSVISGALGFDLWEVLVEYVAFRYDLDGR